MRRNIIILLISLGAIGALPLGGVLLAGGSLEPYLEMPPRPSRVVPPPFSSPGFIFMAAGIVATVGPFVVRVIMGGGVASARTPYEREGPTEPVFPWWGWIALLWTGFMWVAAWSRWRWMGELQLHTFTPLWLGYIGVINAFTYSRIGSCLMLRHPAAFVGLFPVSALFWWSFEYLNLFVHNWYYVGGRAFTAGEYVLLATLPFSTVLPAVVSTVEWLHTYPRLSRGLDRAWRLPLARTKPMGWLVTAVAVTGLMGMGVWPEYLFPLVWTGPLLLITGLQLIVGDATLLTPAVQGDWRELWLAGLAALMCGFFWELWNVRSAAHWEYAIPYVGRFHIFEMPLLGYAGYLPFGLECLAVTRLLWPKLLSCMDDLSRPP